MPPSRLIVKSKFSNIHGGYLFVQTHDGLPSYRRDASDAGAGTYLFHKVVRGGRFWHFANAMPTGTEFSFIFRSTSDASTPDVADWPGDHVEYIKEPAGLTNAQREAAQLYHDPNFAHANKSIGDALVRSQNWKTHPDWIPVRHLWEGTWSLFDGIEPRDLLQGSLGDCWLVAAMACLAEFPKEVQAVYGASTELSPNGQYRLKLYDHKLEKMREVVVDEFIPCQPRHWWDERAAPLFSKPNGNEAWVLLMEKAMAKMFGSYAELNGGNPAVAFRALTGEKNTFVLMKGVNESWQKGVLQNDGRFLCSDSTADTSEDVFLSLSEYDRNSYLMAASIDGSAGKGEHKRSDGLVSGHAYSLLQVLDVEDHRLLCLRNPWGNGTEWNGPWSDKDPIWNRFPRLRQRLQVQFEDDGLFWMSWKDFESRFNTVCVCGRAMRTGEAAKAHSRACLAGLKSPSVSSNVVIEHAEDESFAKAGVPLPAAPDHLPKPKPGLQVTPPKVAPPPPDFHPALPPPKNFNLWPDGDLVPDERGIQSPLRQRDAYGHPIHIHVAYPDTLASAPPAPPTATQRSPSRRKRADSPPTPPPPPMPILFAPANLWQPPWPGMPPPPMLANSAALFPQQNFAPWHGQQQSSHFTPRTARLELEGDVHSLSRRVHQVLQQCREVLVRPPSQAREHVQARELAQEMQDIEDACAEMGGDYSDVRMSIIKMRSDLMSRSKQARAVSADARLSSLSTLNRSRLGSPRRHPGCSSTSQLLSPGRGRGPGSAKEAFRARLANLMHVYDHREKVWDLDDIYKEMEHGVHGGPIDFNRDKQLLPPPPKMVLQEPSQRTRATMIALPRPPADAHTRSPSRRLGSM